MQSEIRVCIPANNIAERQYIVRYIFCEFLGIQTDIVVDANVQGYEITFADKELFFQDAFFSLFTTDLTYLNIEYLPLVSWTKNQFLVEDDIPVLYGNTYLEILDNKIVCGIDIFASAFFMLTRWEEYVNQERDLHDRFPAIASIACKNHFLHRPVVNEYIEMLWNMLQYLGYEGDRKERKFELVLTHDIDILCLENPFRLFLRELLKRRNMRMALRRIPDLCKNKLSSIYFLLQASKKAGIQSHFYFMYLEKSNSVYDGKGYACSPLLKKIVNKIRVDGHIIGFHPGYETYKDEQEWQKQKECFEYKIGMKLTEGRQHFLKMDISQTLKIWNRQNMLIDSTLGYADQEGFRCGTGDVFHVFDFLDRKELTLTERPLVVMDGSLKVYRNLSVSDAENILKYYLQVGHKYKMPVTFLFHNSSFDVCEWRGWKKMYHKLIRFTCS